MGLIKWFKREREYARMVYRRKQLTRVIDDANALQDAYNAQHEAMMAATPGAAAVLRDTWHGKVDQILLKARNAIVTVQEEITAMEHDLRQAGRL